MRRSHYADVPPCYQPNKTHDIWLAVYAAQDAALLCNCSNHACLHIAALLMATQTSLKILQCDQSGCPICICFCMMSSSPGATSWGLLQQTLCTMRQWQHHGWVATLTCSVRMCTSLAVTCCRCKAYIGAQQKRGYVQEICLDVVHLQEKETSCYHVVDTE